MLFSFECCTVGAALRFFFAPFTPRRMVVAGFPTLNSAVVGYDDDIVESTEKKLLIVNGVGLELLEDISKFKEVRPLYDARTPLRESPYGLIVRWILSIMIGFSLTAIGWSYMLPVSLQLKSTLDALGFHDLALNLPTLYDWIATSIFLVYFFWLILMILYVPSMPIEVVRLRCEFPGSGNTFQCFPPLDEDIRYSRYTVAQLLKKLGTRISIEIPRELRERLEKAADSLTEAVSSLVAANYWQKLSMELLEKGYDLLLARRAGAMLTGRKLVLPRWLLLLLLLLVVGAIAWYILQPQVVVPVNQTGVETVTAPPPPPPPINATSPAPAVAPAPPPPPPINATNVTAGNVTG